jgi:uncharacterized protein
MELKELLVIGVLVLLALVFSYYFKGNANIEGDRVCFHDECFSVEIVDTPAERTRGLMFRESLDRNGGMFFIFEKSGNYPFWMKNTLIPLDIIWINENQEVVFIGKNVQPCKTDPCPSTNPGKNALYVLELNAGMSDVIGLEVGEKLDFYLN